MPRKRFRRAWPAISWTVFWTAMVLIVIAFALVGCTLAGYGSESGEEWWPNGQKKSERSKRSANVTNIQSDAPAAMMDLLDMGSGFVQKHATAIFGTALPTLLLGSGAAALQRRSGKRERQKIREDAERQRSEEYLAGVLAGRAGAST